MKNIWNSRQKYLTRGSTDSAHGEPRAAAVQHQEGGAGDHQESTPGEPNDWESVSVLK